jgi:hypothetical protein
LSNNQIFYNYKDGFGTSQFPNIGFVMDCSIGLFDLSTSFELLHDRIPKLLPSNLPTLEDNVKKVALIPAQKFNFENYSGLYDLESKDTEVMYDFKSLKSIHSESSYHMFKDGYYDLIYIYAINQIVNVSYKLINEDLTLSDTQDTTMAELIAIHCRYHLESHTVELVNAELVLHEEMDNTVFNASLYMVED